jgi:hypothetical protein
MKLNPFMKAINFSLNRHRVLNDRYSIVLEIQADRFKIFC